MNKIDKPYYTEFMQQKHNAKRRNIEFLLTYDEWMKIWLNSGKLHLRGKTRGCYVMSRYGDSGPYSADNVEIKSMSENATESGVGNKYNTGRKQSFNQVEQNRIRMMGNKHAKTKFVDDDIRQIRKLFESGTTNKELSEQFNVSRATITRITRKQCWANVD